MLVTLGADSAYTKKYVRIDREEVERSSRQDRHCWKFDGYASMGFVLGQRLPGGRTPRDRVLKAFPPRQSRPEWSARRTRSIQTFMRCTL